MATLRHRVLRLDEVLPLRPEDEAGIAAFGFAGTEPLNISRKNSLESYMAELDGEPMVAWGFGAHGLAGMTAYAWALTSPRSAEFPITFLRTSQELVAYVLTKFPRVEVMCHEPHRRSLEWLRWLGFTPFGRDGEFIRLERVR